MVTVTGSVLRGDEVLLDSVPVKLEVGTSGYLKEWRGWITVPVDKRTAIGEHFTAGQGALRLVLDDGRSGEILLTHFNLFGSDPVSFTGSGDLS